MSAAAPVAALTLILAGPEPQITEITREPRFCPMIKGIFNSKLPIWGIQT